MAIANTSYLTNIAEFEDEFTDGRYLRKLATRREGDTGEDPLSGSRLDYTTRAMNWSARRLENLVRKMYELTPSGKIVDTVSSTSPDETFKVWNARLAIAAMEQWRHYAEPSENVEKLLTEISQALALGSPEVFGLNRNDFVYPFVRNGRAFRGTLADLSDQFGNILRRGERDASFNL